MSDLLSYQAKVCWTVAGCLIHEDKALLIKHRKVGIWLNPGGHIEPGEVPHQAAEREFWEETGVKTHAKKMGSAKRGGDFLPSPISTNVHWVCQDNYESRVKGKPLTEYAQTHWRKGCEQHLNLLYLLEADSLPIIFKQNVEETDGIGWFTLEEARALKTTPAFISELEHAFSVVA